MPATSHARAREKVASVLDYFVNMQRLAQWFNDRRAVMHFEECWAEVWRAYSGGYSLPARAHASLPACPSEQVPASKPPWMIQKYARPVRRVVARVEERVRVSRNGPAVRVSYDVLECGHKVEGNENYGAAQPARHRRCGECVAREDVCKEEHGERRNSGIEDAPPEHLDSARATVCRVR